MGTGSRYNEQEDLNPPERDPDYGRGEEETEDICVDCGQHDGMHLHTCPGHSKARG